MRPGPMVVLTSAPNAFAARVVAARLGTEGIVWELRGNVDGPYPVGEVEVLVREDELGDARYLMLADEIESSYLDVDLDADLDVGDDDDGFSVDFRPPRALWVVLVSVVALPAFSLGRLVVGL